MAISLCLTFTGTLQYGVQLSAEVENHMTSVERITEYADLPQEAAEEVTDKDPPKSWPDKGVVEFRDLHLRYADKEPYVLKGINLKTKENEKIGIIGRTGAGKSSLITALFRLAEPSGKNSYRQCEYS